MISCTCIDINTNFSLCVECQWPQCGEESTERMKGKVDLKGSALKGEKLERKVTLTAGYYKYHHKKGTCLVFK